MSRSLKLKESLPKLMQGFQSNCLKSGKQKGMFPILSESRHNRIFQKYPNHTQRQAAVLVPLLFVEDEPHILFTVRASNLNTHASEISFPGGHWDRNVDKSLVDTALRETREELMLEEKEPIVILGMATAVPSIKGVPVTPVVGVMERSIPRKELWKGNPQEVKKVFVVSVSQLLETETSEPLKRLGDKHGPVFPSPHGKIWGLTAFVLRPILHKIFKPVFCEVKQGL